MTPALLPILLGWTTLAVLALAAVALGLGLCWCYDRGRRR